jgi:DNA-binding Lrp family transcriptional regulator
MSLTKFIIDWIKFDGYSFQEMCNHLLVKENINVEPLRAGPYADGGLDAFLFEGAIGDLYGKFRFQAKYHQPRPGATNYNILKKELKGTRKTKGELDKAGELNADYLIIMTNIPLTIRQKGELLKLAEERPFRLHIWDEEKIKALLVNNPYVRFFHINGPEYPMFVPAQHFFEKFLIEDSEGILTHLIYLVGREKELDEFRAFLLSEENLLSIFAPPGQGKSRLLLEFSRVAEKEIDWIPVFLRPDGKLLKDHLEELNPRLKYLVFLDDAHQYYDRLREFLTLLKGGADIPKIKLVLAARTSLSGLVKDKFEEIQPSELREILIAELPHEIILKILKEELPFLNEVQTGDLLPFVKDSPLLAVAAARLIKLGKPLEEILKPGQLRRLLFEIPLSDLSKYCSQTGQYIEIYQRILRVISAVQPISLGDKNLIDQISKYLGVDESTFISKVDKLKKFGFIKQFGRKIRINPEILSDVILEHNLLTSDGGSTGLGENLAEYFFNNCLKELLDNLSDVGQISFKGGAADILEKVFKKIERDVKGAGNYERSKIINNLKVVGSRRAKNVISIIEIIIANPKTDSLWTHSSLLGEISHLLGITAYNYNYITGSLEILKRLILMENVNTHYSNYKPEEVIKKILGYDVGKLISFQEKALKTLIRWKDQEEKAYILAIRSLSPLFNRTISFTRSSGASMTFGNMSLYASPEVISLREKALDFLLQALNSGIKSVQLAAVKTAAEIGRTGIGPAPGETPDFEGVIEKERLSVIAAFEGLISSGNLGFLLTAEIELLLWHWWQSKSEILALRCLDLLKLIPRTVDYELFKYLHILHCFILPNLTDAEAQKTVGERHNFYHDLVREEFQEKREFINSLIDKIDHLDNYEYWSNLLDIFAKEADNQNTWKYGEFLAALARRSPELGKYFYETKKSHSWERYGPAFLSGIREVDAGWCKARIKALISSTDIKNEGEIIDSIYAISRGNYYPEEIELLKTFSLHGTEKIREVIAATPLRFTSQLSWYLTEEIAGNLIKNQCSPKALDEICCALLHDRPVELGDALKETERKVLSLLVDLEKIDEYWCQSFIAKFASKNPQLLLDFVRRREANGKELFRLKDVFNKVAPEWKKRADFLELVGEIGSWVTQEGEISIIGGDALEIIHDDDCLKNLEASVNRDNPTSIVRAAKIAANFPKNDKFYDFFALLLDLAQIHGKEIFEEVSHQFYINLIWRYSDSRKIGEHSPRLLKVKNQCSRILESEAIPREVKKVFAKCLNHVDRELDQERLSDEELFGD